MQSSLRFQKWLFETSDEYWRLMQILKRRRKIRKERLDKSAKTTPAEEDNEKSLLRGKTNNQAINDEMQTNQANSVRAIRRRRSVRVLARNGTKVTPNATVDETARQENNIENRKETAAKEGRTEQVSAPSENQTRKAKYKICRAGAGKLLKILKLHFKGVPNRRITWEDLVDKMEVKERPLKPLKIYMENLGT